MPPEGHGVLLCTKAASESILQELAVGFLALGLPRRQAGAGPVHGVAVAEAGWWVPRSLPPAGGLALVEVQVGCH